MPFEMTDTEKRFWLPIIEVRRCFNNKEEAIRWAKEKYKALPIKVSTRRGLKYTVTRKDGRWNVTRDS